MLTGFLGPSQRARRSRERLFDAALLIGLGLFLLQFFEPELLLLDTTPTGGDIPAHNYLAGYLGTELLPRGRLFGWAPGWWSGFPMFQFYFFLPYLLMNALAALPGISLPVAFKFTCALAVVATPAAAWGLGRTLGYRFPAPAILALFMIPFLMVHSHTIWGLNIYSLLSGEIANAFSFPLFLLYLGVAYRAVRRRRGVVLAALLLALTVMTHLTTGLVAAAVTLTVPFLSGGKQLGRGILRAGAWSILALLLVAFWLAPLIAKLPYTTEFGEDWKVDLLKSLPPSAWVYALLALIGLITGIWRRERRPFYALSGLAISYLFFRFGFHLNLVNIRFWGFLYFFLLLGAAHGAAVLLRRFRFAALAVVLLLLVYDAVYSHAGAEARSWARWNFEGFERKATWPVYHALIERLRGTPGRAAHDLHDANNRFGSVRAFEALPYFIGKPTVEGGIIQSAFSAPFAMAAQCDYSRSCAGFPRIVTPGRYNFDAATRHFELLNVKQIIAFHPRLQQDLAQDHRWRELLSVEGYKLFELTTHDGSYVTVPPHWPLHVRTEQWLPLALDWFYQTANLDQPLVLDPAGLDEARARALLRARLGPGDGTLYNWHLLGPFPNPRDPQLNFWDPASDHPFRPVPWEAALDPLRPGPRNRSWIACYSGTAFIDLTRPLGELEEVTAYAATFLVVSRPTTAILHFGSDDGIQIWLDGKRLRRDHRHHPYDPQLGTLRLDLSAGIHRLIAEVENAGGAWGFSMRLTDPRGRVLETVSDAPDPAAPPLALPPAPAEIRRKVHITEQVEPDRIEFSTDAVGLPHLIKVSYFPDWKVEGAAKIYLATPSYMLVYPQRSHVVIYYARGASDWIGLALSALALLGLAGWMWRRRGHRPRFAA